jgi:monoterpene epsilon-lactone hydrolase
MPSPELDAVIAELRRNAPSGPVTIDQARASYVEQVRRYELVSGTEVTTAEIAGIPVEWVTAPAANTGITALFVHGGAYVIGSFASHRQLASALSAACTARVAMVGYRQAPEHPFPAALQDVTAVYRELVGDNVRPERLLVLGDSSGGGLALAMLLHVRDLGVPLPAATVVMSPWTDLELTGGSMDDRAAQDPVLSRETLSGMAALYLDGHDPADPLVSPLRGDLRGLPPLLVQVGTAEVLLDDSVRLADVARAAGVDVTLERYEGLIHVWQQNAANAPEAQQALAHIGAFVRTRIRE